MVVLHEGTADAVLAITISVVGLEEKTAAILTHVRLDDEDAPQSRLDDPHLRARDRECETDIDRTRSIPSLGRAAAGPPHRCSPCDRQFPRGRLPSPPGALRSPECNSTPGPAIRACRCRAMRCHAQASRRGAVRAP